MKLLLNLLVDIKIRWAALVRKLEFMIQTSLMNKKTVFVIFCTIDILEMNDDWSGEARSINLDEARFF